MRFFEIVLIESDWNLKTYICLLMLNAIKVLIESDWNLKVGTSSFNVCAPIRINRIRLEFKAISETQIYHAELMY